MRKASPSPTQIYIKPHLKQIKVTENNILNFVHIRITLPRMHTQRPRGKLAREKEKC